MPTFNPKIMLQIKTIEIAGLFAATQAVRLPHNKPAISKGEWNYRTADYSESIAYSALVNVGIEKKDIELMRVLKTRGDEHAKVLRGIIVWAEIYAPVYYFNEEETYRIGHERLSSESTMHGVAKGLTGDELVKVKSELPMGTMLKKVDYFSYQTLRRIYYQRRDHRLPEWHTFCEWIETLPFANELILGE